MDDKALNKIGYEIIGAAFEVRRRLGMYLNESAYEAAMKIELAERGIASERQMSFPVTYKGVLIKNSYVIDLLVEGCVPIEFKALKQMGGYELSQIMSYLVFGNFSLGYLINFHAAVFTAGKVVKDCVMDRGIYRIINNITKTTPSITI